jgi:hypothetical protein
MPRKAYRSNRAGVATQGLATPALFELEAIATPERNYDIVTGVHLVDGDAQKRFNDLEGENAAAERNNAQSKTTELAYQRVLQMLPNIADAAIHLLAQFNLLVLRWETTSWQTTRSLSSLSLKSFIFLRICMAT